MTIRQLAQRVLQSPGARQPIRRPKNSRRQLILEGLEERTLPTALYNFNPSFGPEPAAGDSGDRLNHAPVYLILWGSSWNDTTSPQSSAITQAAAAVMSSPYLSGIQQYGSDGIAYFGNAVFGPVIWDGHDSPKTVGKGDIDDEIDSAVDQAFFPANDKAIYVVVTAPGVVWDTPGARGDNFVGDYPSIWVSTTTTGNNTPPAIYVDGFARIFSHELAECMSCPDGNGVLFNPGDNFMTTLPTPGQIGDYEGNNYSFREPNGVQVQPYWSASDNAWLAPDGNTQTLVLAPYWNNVGFSRQYDLMIAGDQLLNQGGTANDSINIDTQGGFLVVTLNGERTLFDPGMIRNITINSGAGDDIITVESLAGATSAAPVLINLSNGHDTVNVTPLSHNLGNLQGDIQVNGGNSFATLNVYDQANPTSGFYIMDAAKVLRSAANTIYHSGISSLNVYGADVPMTFYINDTEGPLGPFVSTSVYCGSAGTVVNVRGTTGNLNILPASFTDVVNLSLLQNIQGLVTIQNNALTDTLIYVDDSADTIGRPGGTLDSLVPSGETLSFGIITGMAPAPIQFAWLGTQNVSITTGMGDDTFNVRSTQRPVFLDSAGGTDTVNVGGGGPTAASGDVQRILDVLAVSNGNGLTKINVDDSGDAQGKSSVILMYGLPIGVLTGLAPADITFNGTELASLTVRGGSGGNHFFIRGTPGAIGPGAGTGPIVSLFAGAGADIVDVGDTSNTLDGIQGPFMVSGQAAYDILHIYDQGSHTAHTYTLTSTPLTSTIQRSEAAPITYDSTTENVIVYGSDGVDTYAVQSPIPALGVTFVGMGTLNTLKGSNLPNTFWQILGSDAGRLGLVAFMDMQNLLGGGSSNTFHFSSAGAISGTIDGGSSQTNTLDYSATNTPVAIHLALRYASRIRGGANNGFTRIDSVLGSSAANNSLTGLNATNLWLITGANLGNVGLFRFSNIGTLVGGSGVDTFRFTAVGHVSGRIDGFGGGDWLDYSLRTTAVTVDLAAGAATSVAGGVNRIQNVIGSAGNDTLTGDSLGNILIGGPLTNILRGGSGRSLLIGGRGASTIMGGTADDILIAGTTLYDGNEDALAAILKEWQRTDLSYTERVAALSNGSDKLVWGVSVFDNDAAGAHVFGGAGMDWIFKGPDDH